MYSVAQLELQGGWAKLDFIFNIYFLRAVLMGRSRKVRNYQLFQVSLCTIPISYYIQGFFSCLFKNSNFQQLQSGNYRQNSNR